MFTDRYAAIFRNSGFRNFWLGYTLSSIGDGLTRVALTWYVYEKTHSPQALGMLAVAYIAPVLVGGFAAGWMLDRFDRRLVMLADTLLRGLAVAAIPLLHWLGLLEVWHTYVVAAVFGSLFMIALAGGPSIVPSLVSKDQLDTANALEMIGFTLGALVAPALAGLLIGVIGAPNVITLDALSYFGFALVLMQLRVPPSKPAATQNAKKAAGSLAEVFRLLVSNPVLILITIMFALANVGSGTMNVWLPIYAAEDLMGGAQTYGLLLAVSAAGEVISSVLAGGTRIKLPLGTLICVSQLLTGLALGAMLLGQTVWLAAPALAFYGFTSAPLTIWAQTLRMEIIPEELRGRTFALLRTLMMGALPLGGWLAGQILPRITMLPMIGFAAVMISLPGLLAYLVKDMREAGPVPEVQAETASV
jgi:MFS family permease